MKEITQSCSVCHITSFWAKLTALKQATVYLKVQCIVKLASLINNGEEELFPIGIE